MDGAGARTTLHTFEFSLFELILDGTPMSNLFEGADGSLYGTTFNMPRTVFFPSRDKSSRLALQATSRPYLTATGCERE